VPNDNVEEAVLVLRILEEHLKRSKSPSADQTLSVYNHLLLAYLHH
jgi:hypothetical protein